MLTFSLNNMKILSAQCIAPVLERGNYDWNGYKYSFRISDIYEDKLNWYTHSLARLYNNIYIPHRDSLLLSSISKVQVTYDEYQERWSSEVWMFDLSTQDGYEKMYEWHRKWNLRLEDINNGWSWDNGYDQWLNEEQKYWLKHVWWDWEVYHAESYKDITIVEQYNWEWSKEYYSTPEIIEVLEKWIEALERWNNPEERKKMIVEYEASERKKNHHSRD